MTKDKPLATVEEEEPGDSYSFVVCVSGQPLLFQHECVCASGAAKTRETVSALPGAQLGLTS